MNIYINYAIILIAMLITLLAQSFISICYSKYKRQKNNSNISGSKIARYILDKNGLTKVKVEKVSGNLTDHYDPRNKVVRLSYDIYEGDSIASLAVAAHECGHAIQDMVGYKFMRFRAFLVPVVNFVSYSGYLAIVLGLLLGSTNTIWLGIISEIMILIFQLVTLPVEFNASKRALKELNNYDLITKKEVRGSKMMLIAAASTYVASVANTLLQILRLVMIVNRRKK